jgi:hypothetical protein
MPDLQDKRCNKCNGPMELARLEPATSWAAGRSDDDRAAPTPSCDRWLRAL